MSPYNNTLPKFTAEASLLNSRSARDSILSNRVDYIMVSINTVTIGGNVMPSSHEWCSGCTECDPDTRTKECSHWDDRISDCITSVHSPATQAN